MGLVGSVEVEASVTTSPVRGEVGNHVSEAFGGPGGGGSGGLVTVRVAARVTAGSPMPLENTARNMCPLSAGVSAASVSVFVSAPGISWKLKPPSVDISHCTVGLGVPAPAAL